MARSTKATPKAQSGKVRVPKDMAGDKPTIKAQAGKAQGGKSVVATPKQEVLAPWKFDVKVADEALAAARESAAAAANYEAGYTNFRRELAKTTARFVLTLFDREKLVEMKARVKADESVERLDFEKLIAAPVRHYLARHKLPPIHGNAANPFLGIYQAIKQEARVEIGITTKEDRDNMLGEVEKYQALTDSSEDAKELRRLDANEQVVDGRWATLVAAAIDMNDDEILETGNPRNVVEVWRKYRRANPRETIALKAIKPGPQKGESRASHKPVIAAPEAGVTDAEKVDPAALLGQLTDGQDEGQGQPQGDEAHAEGNGAQDGGEATQEGQEGASDEGQGDAGADEGANGDAGAQDGQDDTAAGGEPVPVEGEVMIHPTKAWAAFFADLPDYGTITFRKVDGKMQFISYQAIVEIEA